MQPAACLSGGARRLSRAGRQVGADGDDLAGFRPRRRQGVVERLFGGHGLLLQLIRRGEIVGDRALAFGQDRTDARQRQLFKNIVYIGALATLFDIDFSVLEGHAPFMATLRNAPLTIYATQGAAPEVIEVEGGFAEVNESGLTVLAEHIAS